MDIKIGNREIPMALTTYELIAIQEEIGCTVGQLRDEVFGVHLENEDDPSSIRFGVINDGEKLEKFGKLIRILGNAGLEEQGEDPDLTDKWVLRHIKPGMIMIYVIALVAVISDGNKVESITQKEEEGPVDEVLEEQNAKKQPGN